MNKSLSTFGRTLQCSEQTNSQNTSLQTQGHCTTSLSAVGTLHRDCPLLRSPGVLTFLTSETGESPLFNQWYNNRLSAHSLITATRREGTKRCGDIFRKRKRLRQFDTLDENTPTHTDSLFCISRAGSPSFHDSHRGSQGCCGKWHQNKTSWCAEDPLDGCPLSS